MSKINLNSFNGQALSSPVYPRVRKPSKASPPPSLISATTNNDHASFKVSEELQAAFQKELETKEVLYAQLHEKDQQILGLNDQILQLRESLANLEKQLLDAYNEQSRMEEDICTHQAVTEKLREQFKEAEKEKRDTNRRYQEQVKSFDAERQSFYDNEQHLKSRIRSLAQAQSRLRQQVSNGSFEKSVSRDAFEADRSKEEESSYPMNVDGEESEKLAVGNDEYDTPEVASLKLELSTLSISYASLQNTVQHLQMQVSDLQRVNNHLQDENESYNILLVEKTMAGQFDVRKQLVPPNREQGDDADRNLDGRSIRSNARSMLDRVSELEELGEDEGLQHGNMDYDPFNERPPSEASRRHTRSRANSPTPQGESLAGLPLTGPGLDLAAELGRAENRDTVDDSLLDVGVSPTKLKSKRTARVAETTNSGDEVKTLRNEVKSLKDANKALSLYASKILDRIIAQEGFEHVLAVDYKERIATPIEQSPEPPKKSRPQTTLFSMGSSNSSPSKSGSSIRDNSATAITAASSSISPSEDNKRQRRSMSFDWRSFSSWGGGEKKAEPKNLRPLTLRPGATPIVTAKRLDTEEDEEDRRERERLAATMKLMGIEMASQVSQISAPAETRAESGPKTEKLGHSRRWSLFRSAAPSTPTAETPRLTRDALHQAEASETLKQLDERERDRIEHLAKGASGGFTEPKSRRSVSDEWRSRRDARCANDSTGSASTIWSAGMSNKDERSTKNSTRGSP